MTTSTPGNHPDPHPDRPDERPGTTTSRQLQRRAITEHFLTALEDVVWRYRALATRGEHADRYAEVVTAEVAHQLAVTRGALHRHPALRRTPRTPATMRHDNDSVGGGGPVPQ